MTEKEFQIGDLVEIAEFGRGGYELQIAVVTGYKKYYWGKAVCIITTNGENLTKDPLSLGRL